MTIVKGTSEWDIQQCLGAVTKVHGAPLAKKLLEYLKELERRAEDICDVCAGTGVPLSEGPCACGGTGRMSDTVVYLRLQLHRVEMERDEVKRVHSILDLAYQALAADYKALIDE